MRTVATIDAQLAINRGTMCLRSSATKPTIAANNVAIVATRFANSSLIRGPGFVRWGLVSARTVLSFQIFFRSARVFAAVADSRPKMI